MRHRLTCLLLACISALGSPVRADDDTPASRPNLVVAGGVSLGAYQAGMVYFFNEQHLGERRPGYQVAVGTSAGAVNAAIGAFAACAERQPKPEQSVHYRVWVPLGIDGEPSLFSPKAVTARSILAPAAVDAATKRFVEWIEEPHQWQSCSTALGVTATRLSPRRVPIPLPDGGVPTAQVVRQSERFLIEIRTGPGRSPSVYPYRAPAPLTDFYPHLGRGELDEPLTLEALIDGVVASGAFPVAFPPRNVVERITGPDGTLGPARTVRYVDGGVYANVPLSLAVQLQRWRDPRPADVLLVHPELTPLVPEWGESPTPTSSLGRMLQRFFGDFVQTSLLEGMVEGIVDQPELRQPDGAHLFIPPRRTVTASEHLGAFAGFFDASFRAFDFYLGMLDARASIVARGGTPPRVDSATFDCFVAWDDASSGFTKPVERMPSACIGAPEDMRNLLRASSSYRRWLVAQPDEPPSDAKSDKWFALLDDVGAQPSGAELRESIRRLLGEAVERMAAAQPSMLEGASISILGPIALNSLRYEEPEAIAALGGFWDRGAEVAVGLRPGLSWLRFDLGLRGSAIGTSYLHPRLPERRGWMASAFAHVVWLPSSGPWFQVEPYIGAGIAAPLRGFLGRPVAFRTSIDAGLHWVALQRIYLTTGASTYVHDHFVDGYRPEANALTDAPLRLDLALGVRLFL